MARGGGWNRKYPYFKVQVFDDRLSTWLDVKTSFETVDAAKEYINQKLTKRRTRLIIVEGERDRRVFDEV